MVEVISEYLYKIISRDILMSEKKEPKGIGGWLLIPTITLLFSTFLFTWISFFLFLSLIFLSFSLYNFVLMIITLILLGLTLASIILEFQKNKLFPRMAILTLAAGFLLPIILNVILGDYSDVSLGASGTAIWIVYFLVSKRVKNTFVKTFN